MKKPQEDHLKELRTRIAKAPVDPGVYRWIDANGDVLYVGKAKSLKSRLKSYVQKKPDLAIGPWKLALRAALADVDWTVTETELEALILETNLIKELKPKYNVLMKDDKNYVYVRITVKDPYPAVTIIRRIEDDKAKYFGPFLSAHHIHRTLDMLHDVYGWRACERSLNILNKHYTRHAERSESRQEAGRTESKHLASEGTVSENQRRASTSSFASSTDAQDFAQHDIQKLKPCLDSQIGKCNGLCAGKVTQEEYRRRIDAMMRFFKGDRSDFLAKLKEKMQRAAEKKLFEDAAKLRDTFNYVQSLEEQQFVSDTSGADTDYVGVALLSDKAHVVVLRERGGKIISERSYALGGRADTHGKVLGQFLPQYYIATEEIPDTIVCAEEPEERDTLEVWLAEKKRRKVAIHTPERGKKSKLLLMAERNAEEKVKQQLARWEAATEKVESALEELRDALHLPEKPHRIECYDISHLGGTETVGSMVVFINGKARNSDYRSFTIRTMHKGEIDDYKALKEVLRRRLRHLKNSEKEWNERGVFFERAKKADISAIEEILIKNEQAFKGSFDAHEFIIARKEKDIVGFGRLVARKGNIHLIQSIWVDDRHRGNKLGHVLLQKLITKAKKRKVYITIHPHLEEYYAQAGFRHVHAPPSVIEEAIAQARTADPHFPEEGRIVMVFVVADHRTDTSLNAKPDLLVLDGGKGQLSVGVELLKNMKLDIPVISLAKREEEVFAPGNPNPLPFSEESEARFLLMRLRDEAHRFANRHREKRLKNALMKEE